MSKQDMKKIENKDIRLKKWINVCYNSYRKGLKMKKSTKKPEMIEKSKFYALLMVTAVLAAVIVFLICYMFL
mgnify:FL=1